MSAPALRGTPAVESLLAAVPVDSPWTAVGLGGAALAVLLATLLLRRRRAAGRRRTRRDLVAAVALALPFVLATCGDAADAHFAYLPRASDVVSVAVGDPAWPLLTPAGLASTAPPVGQVSRLEIPGRASGFGPTTAWVWLPPQYATQPHRRFPVVYLLHGSPGVPADFFRGAAADVLARQLADRGHPAILVAPRMSRGWLDDSECVDGVREPAASHLLLDVLPTVDATLRTDASAAGRVIAGNSAGGYCALNLGLRNPRLFGSILDLSGFTHPTYAHGLDALFGPGPAGRAEARADDPGEYVPAATTPLPHQRIWLDVGTEDTVPRAQLTAIAPQLRARGLDVVLRTRPGGHTFHVWRPALADALAWTLAPTGRSR